LLCLLWCLNCKRTRRWKCRDVVLPVSARWRRPQEASGWPRRLCPAMPSRRAPGRLVSNPASLSHWPSASLSDPGLWPCWSIPVSQAHRACSVMLLLDANLFQLTVFAIPGDALLVSPPSLSAIILTEMLFWNLHVCKLQLTLVNTYNTSLPQLSSSILWYQNDFPVDAGISKQWC
jgi:hypothetical protein